MPHIFTKAALHHFPFPILHYRVHKEAFLTLGNVAKFSCLRTYETDPRAFLAPLILLLEQLHIQFPNFVNENNPSLCSTYVPCRQLLW